MKKYFEFCGLVILSMASIANIGFAQNEWVEDCRRIQAVSAAGWRVTIAPVFDGKERDRIAIDEFSFERRSYPSIESVKLMQEFEFVKTVHFSAQSLINDKILAEVAEISTLQELYIECGKSYLSGNRITSSDDNWITADGLNLLSKLNNLTSLSVYRVNPTGRLKKDAFGIMPLKHLIIQTRYRSLNTDDLKVISSMSLESLGLDGIEVFEDFNKTINGMKWLKTLELYLDSPESWDVLVNEEDYLFERVRDVSLFLEQLDYATKSLPSLDKLSGIYSREYKRITLSCTSYPDTFLNYLYSECYEFLSPSYRYSVEDVRNVEEESKTKANND